MAHNTIAIIADCDDTLAPDTSVQLLRSCGVDPERFFKEYATSLVAQGWDPSLAYLHELIRLAQDGTIPGLTRERLSAIGRELEFYPGMPDCLGRLKHEIEEDERYREFGIKLDCYVISGGIEEVLEASALRPLVRGLWGCSFAYDENGIIRFPRRVISFTDKTRYVFNIQKGKVADEFKGRPYAVNEPMDASERPVPFEHMIYIGDGPSDIPCMSLVQSNHGYVIGVLCDDNPFRTWALGYGRRANLTVPREFADDGFGYKFIKQAATGIADQICRDLTAPRAAPGY